MSQPFLTVSAAGLKAAGVGLTAAEAVACVVLAGDALDWSSDAPDPSHLLLRSDGRIDVTPGAHRPPRVEAYARLLHRLLPDAETTGPARVPGALRLAVARGLGVLDAPPFASLQDFRAAIARFLTHSPEELIVGIVVRWAEAMGSRADEPLPERRVAGTRVDVLRRMLHEADLERFALLNEHRTPVLTEHAAAPRSPIFPPAPQPVAESPERTPFAVLPPHSVFEQASVPVRSTAGIRLRSIAVIVLVAGILGWAGSVALRDREPDVASATPPLSDQARVAAASPGAAQPAPPSELRETVSSPEPADARDAEREVAPVAAAAPEVAARGAVATGDTIGGDARAEVAARGEITPPAPVDSGTGFQLANVVDGPHRAENVSLSPDGTRVAFDSDRDGVRAVYVADRDGTDVRRVSGQGYAAGPAWSPDGERLAMLRAEDRMSEVQNLWVLNLESGEERRLTQYRYGEMSPPSWFADGRRIAYAQEGRLFVMDTESGATRNYPSPIPGRSIPVLAPSPDNRHVAFGVLDNGVWLLDLHDASVRRVLDDPTVERLVWSPDGRRVAYYSRRARHWGVWVMAER
jgi:hypothetical protein